MTLPEALKSRGWVKRMGWRNWLFYAGERCSLSYAAAGWNRVTFDDVKADDWTVYECVDWPEDDASVRFSLLELDSK